MWKRFLTVLFISCLVLVATLYRAVGEPAVSQSHAYTDVPTGAWYHSAVTWAATNEIVSGYADDSFGSDDPVSREQLVTILWRHAGSPSASADSFADQSPIATYATEAVAWARANDIVSGKAGNRFDPQGHATRAEVAVMLQRFLSISPNANILAPTPATEENDENGGNDGSDRNDVAGAGTALPTLQLTVGDQQLTLTLEDNAVTRDLVSRLPLTLTFADYARAEKIAYLPGDRFDTTGVAGGYNPQVGDLCLYAPWGNLCFFYEDAAYSSGLIHLGQMSVAEMAVLAAQETDFEMRMEVVN